MGTGPAWKVRTLVPSDVVHVRAPDTSAEIAPLTVTAIRVEMSIPRPTGVPRNSLVLRSRSNAPLKESPGLIETPLVTSEEQLLAAAAVRAPAADRRGPARVADCAPGCCAISGT